MFYGNTSGNIFVLPYLYNVLYVAMYLRRYESTTYFRTKVLWKYESTFENRYFRIFEGITFVRKHGSTRTVPYVYLRYIRRYMFNIALINVNSKQIAIYNENVFMTMFTHVWMAEWSKAWGSSYEVSVEKARRIFSKTCEHSHGLCPRGFEPHSRHVRYKNAFFNKNVLCHSTRTMLLSKEHLLMNALSTSRSTSIYFQK